MSIDINEHAVKEESSSKCYQLGLVQVITTKYEELLELAPTY